MFSPRGFFKDVQCPGIEGCILPNCIFSHKLDVLHQNKKDTQASVGDHGDVKRRKLDDGTIKPVDPNAGLDGKIAFVGTLTGQKAKALAPTTSANQMGVLTTTKPISPPPKKVTSVENKKPLSSPSKPVSTPQKLPRTTAPPIRKMEEPKESLNPRMVPKDPAGHGVRMQLVKKLHEAMAKLNEQVLKSSDDDVKKLHLSSNRLIKLVLDEEEKVAREQTTVYSNIVKHQIVRYMKLPMEEWIKLRREAEALANGKKPVTASPVPLETGLSAKEEVAMLSRLITAQDGLEAHGYVIKVPDDADIDSARKGVEAADGWEECDRCKTRFQVFPDRREDGALTSGGRCTHHWGKAYYVTPDPNQPKGPKKRLYSCCQQDIGTPGCTETETHVFKVSDTKRLAYIMPFMETPYNSKANTDRAVCFDCEMGYTCYGLELIRLTATSWPSGDPLLDVLVRPKGAILDLNTRFSGVTADQFFNAPEYDPSSATPEVLNGLTKLHIVTSPYVARDLFFDLVSSDTPVLGHALENDLNSIRVVHPAIVDTVLLFPHPRGLPIRYGLRVLVKMHLGRSIQTAGAAGHDSLEDAKATGDLARWKVGQEWKLLKHQGWAVQDSRFLPPQSNGPQANLQLSNQDATKKRPREDEEDNGSGAV